MEALKFIRKEWKPFLVVTVLCLLTLMIMLEFYPKQKQLNGLLVDLELDGPDPARYGELRDAVTRRLADEVPSLRQVKLSLTYVHFAELDRDAVNSERVDFLILSPQRTPWHAYSGECRSKLESLKRLIHELILKKGMPVLGICGGHQFLALAFGGDVGFIDPKFTESTSERYPREAQAERGVVQLQTLGDDPIFEGLVHHPGRFEASQSHYEEVKVVPKPFVNLARSEISEAQLIRIPGRPVYGMAFHPERGWDGKAGSVQNGGKQILANFFRMVAKANQGH